MGYDIIVDDEDEEKYTALKLKWFIMGIMCTIISYILYTYFDDGKVVATHSLWHVLLYSGIGVLGYSMPMLMRKKARYGKNIDLTNEKGYRVYRYFTYKHKDPITGLKTTESGRYSFL